MVGSVESLLEGVWDLVGPVWGVGLARLHGERCCCRVGEGLRDEQQSSDREVD